jgi:membrane-associated phospholipid phosphatase
MARTPAADSAAEDLPWRTLLTLSAAWLVACSALVALCYLVVDRPVAFFVRDHGLPAHRPLTWLTYPPPVLQEWAPLALAALAVRRAWGPFARWQLALLAACVALLVAEQLRETIKPAFGRYWPDTWVHDNPSLLRDGAYGFHPFHWGDAYASFPSGHTARAVAVAAVFWAAYPAWRWACALCALAVAAGLVGMNYHFVGDVVAGAYIGGVVGAYSARFCGLPAAAEVSRRPTGAGQAPSGRPPAP